MTTASQINRSWKYDTFLSFRGEDTRDRFTGHLENALLRKGIYYFKDDKGLKKGEEIHPALVKAIEESRFSLVVFSRNYAASIWCLNELVKIIECKQSRGQIIKPIFYDVEPSEVRNQNGFYGDALSKQEQEFKHNMEKVKKWREALTEAGNLSGWTIAGNEAEHIEKIVDDILKELNRAPLYIARYPVGIDFHLEEINQRLDIDSKDVKMIGIIGVHGIGKSTIAKAAFNSYANCFDGSSFVDNIGEKFNRNHDLHKIQQNLLSEILGDTSLKVYNEDRGVNIIKERLSSRKVFLVLDNVDDLKQLEKLAGGHDWFGSGSRILITTRKKKLLNLHGVQSIYELKRMSQREALKLFSWHALQRDKPVGGNMELVNAALRYTKGIPLFLVKLATDLFSKSMSYWGSELYEEIGQDGKNIEEGENRIRVWNKLNEQFKIRYNVETKTLDPSLAQLFRQALEVKSDVQLDTTILDESADVDWDHDVGFDLDYDDEKIKDAMTCHNGNASDGDGLFMEDQQSQHEDNATQLSQDGDDKFEDANTDFDRNILDDDGDAYSIPTQPSQDGEDNFEDVSTNYDGNMLDGDGDGEDELGDVRTNYSGNALDGNGDGEDKFGDVSTYYGGNALDGEDKFGDVSTYYDENALNVNGDGEDKFGDVSTYYGGNALDGEDKFGDVSTYYDGNALNVNGDGEDKFGDVSTYYGGNALNGDGDGEYELGDVRTYYDGNALDGDGDGEDKFGDVSTYYGGNALNGDGDGENELGDVRTYYDGNALYGDEDGEDKFGDVSIYYGGNALDGYGDEDNLGDVRTYYGGNALDGDGDGEDKFGNVSTYYAGNASDGDDKFGDVATDSFGDALYGEGDDSLIEPSQDDDGPIDETMYLENTTSLSDDFD